MECNLLYGILQVTILEWAAVPSPGDLPTPGGSKLGSPALAGWFFTSGA